MKEIDIDVAGKIALLQVATSKALKVKVPGIDVDDNGTVVKVNFSSHRIGDAEATALAEVHQQMPMRT